MEITTPFHMILSSSTMCGKTCWTLKFLRQMDKLLDKVPENVYYFYNQYNEAFGAEDLSHVQFIHGLPDEISSDSLIILDDYMQNKEAQAFLAEMSVQGVHHKNSSVIQLRQNLFHGGRTSRINAQYICLLRNPTDKLQIQTLGRQVFPRSKGFLLEAYEDATKKPYGYLFLNLHPASTDENLRVVSGIFSDEDMYVYLPKKK